MYGWVRHFSDGTVEYQYNRDTAQELLWGNPSKPITKVGYVPFSNDLSQKLQSKGINAIASNLPPHFVTSEDQSDKIYAYRARSTSTGDRMKCSICGFTWSHTGKGFAVCPQCGCKDDWYCDKCKDFKDNQVRNKRGEVNCPDCKTPQGLRRIKNIHRITFVDETIQHYGIRTSKFDLHVLNDGTTTTILI